MSVTAARLGASPVLLDWSNLSPGAPGATADPAALSEAWKALQSRFQKGEIGFFDSPKQNTISQLKESLELAAQITSEGKFTDCLFLGIGGSALGPVSLLQALEHRRTTSLKFHFMENPDPVDWNLALQNLKPQSTLVCVVTKSGTTFETISQFLLALEWLGRERWKTHIIAITDPEKGDLKTFADVHGIRRLSIHPSVGGRFSIFTPVGLFPAALAGLSATDFLKGAEQVSDHLSKVALEKNPLMILAHHFLRQASERPVHVLMPYSSRLRMVSNWWVQLWGESLGKDGKGFTPIGAVGAIDQHSILQLLRDGPNDKITGFITVEKSPDPVRIPRLNLNASEKPGSFSQLENHSLEELLKTEYRATALVLTKQERPHFTIQIEQLDERSMGALYFTFSALTAITGTLWQINPFDQPGVEEGKIYIRQFLSESRTDRLQTDDHEASVSRLRLDRN